MTIKLTQDGTINFIESGNVSTSNSVADIRISNMGHGSTYMTITTVGNVGIGTTNPNTFLHIQNSTVGNYIGNVVFNSPNISTNTIISPIVIGKDLNNNNVAEFRYGYVGSGSTSNYAGISFFGNPSTPFIVNASGNIGIGTSSPNVKTEIRGSVTNTTPETILKLGRLINGGVDYGSSADFQVYKAYSASQYDACSGLRIRLGAGQGDHPDTTIMTLFANGNVGIGTTSPSNVLSVRGSGGMGTIRIYPNSYRGETSIGFYENSTSGNAWILGQGGWSGGTNFILGHDGFGGPILAVTTAGNVRIGTSYSNNGKLEIRGSASTTTPETILMLGRSDNFNVNFAASADFQLYKAYSSGNSLDACSGLRIRLGAGFVYEPDTTIMTLWANGRVGIGTSSPSQTLDVNGTINTTNFIGSNNTMGTINSGEIKSYIYGQNFLRIAGRAFQTNQYNGIFFSIERDPTESRRRYKQKIIIEPTYQVNFEIPGEYARGNMHFLLNNELNDNEASMSDIRMTINANGTVSIPGSLSKGSGSFDIKHPNDEDKRLVHSFIEGPRCDLIYRGTVQLTNGTATINLDTDCVEESDCAMTEGTFESLCRNPQFFLQNLNSFNRIIGSISGNILSIICENESSTDTISWMVVAERNDPHIYSWNRTNENGYLKTEHSS
jgi:hypothetical protein